MSPAAIGADTSPNAPAIPPADAADENFERQIRRHLPMTACLDLLGRIAASYQELHFLLFVGEPAADVSNFVLNRRYLCRSSIEPRFRFTVSGLCRFERKDRIIKLRCCGG